MLINTPILSCRYIYIPYTWIKDLSLGVYIRNYDINPFSMEKFKIKHTVSRTNSIYIIPYLDKYYYFPLLNDLYKHSANFRRIHFTLKIKKITNGKTTIEFTCNKRIYITDESIELVFTEEQIQQLKKIQ